MQQRLSLCSLAPSKVIGGLINRWWEVWTESCADTLPSVTKHFCSDKHHCSINYDLETCVGAESSPEHWVVLLVSLLTCYSCGWSTSGLGGWGHAAQRHFWDEHVDKPRGGVFPQHYVHLQAECPRTPSSHHSSFTVVIRSSLEF